MRRLILLMTLLAPPVFAQNQVETNDDAYDARLNFDLGLGNKHWSYAELTAFKPIVNSDNGLVALDMHYMTHVGDENSNSNEKSLGLVYRKLLNDGDSFIGFNTSYSIYETWDGNQRQTPHLGIEFVGQKFTFLANYMFQDDTIHANPTVTNDYHPIYDMGDQFLHAGEAFTGGFESVARYSVSDRFSLGVGYYERFGDGDYEVTERVSLTSATGEPMSRLATSQVTNSYLLREGYFIDGEMTTDFGIFSFQLKNDDQHNFLGMLAFRVPLGKASQRDLKKSNVQRKYYAPVYKADPDDFGIGLLVAAGVAAGLEATASVSVTAAAAAAAADATAAGALATGAANVITAVKKK